MATPGAAARHAPLRSHQPSYYTASARPPTQLRTPQRRRASTFLMALLGLSLLWLLSAPDGAHEVVTQAMSLTLGRLSHGLRPVSFQNMPRPRPTATAPVRQAPKADWPPRNVLPSLRMSADGQPEALGPLPKVVFMGTPDFASFILEKMIASKEYDIVAVYCQPPRQAGRGRKVTKSAVQNAAEAAGLPVLHPVTLRNATAQEVFRAFDADIAVVAAYGLLLPPPILEGPRLGCVNVHGSLLPRWRGAAPIQYSILSGDDKTGVTIMKMDEGLDTGPMISTAEIPITPETTSRSLFQEMTEVGADLLLRTLPGYLNGDLPPVAQPDEGVTLAPKIKKEEGRLDWNDDAAALERKVRAFDPAPGTYFEWNGARVKVLAAAVKEPQAAFGEGDRGRVVDEELGITCSQGVFYPLRLQKAGGKPLQTADFLRGFPVPVGTLLDDPPAAAAA